MDNHSEPEKAPQEVVKDARKQITRSAVFAIAALVVIVFACYAWFVSTNNVSANIGGIQIMGSPFELASVGAGSLYDKMLPDDLRIPGGSWKHSSENGTVTGANDSILWNVSTDSNLNNVSNESDNLQPGAKGSMQFYVIPKADGALKLSFQLELIPMMLPAGSTDQFVEATQDEVLLKLLKGHFLFNQEINGKLTWIECQSGTFTLTFSDCKKDTPELVTLNWTWPYLLSHVTKQTEVVSWMIQAPDYFFYNDGRGFPAPTVGDLKPDATSYATYDQLFNNADQYIGDHADGLFLRLTAQAI